MNTARRSCTRELILEAVRLLESSARPIAHIERELGTGDGCLAQWRREIERITEDARRAVGA